MPRVKIDNIVSFSSEDPEHPASNLLQREVSKKKWLCRRGEPTCSVLLQLHSSVQISGVHVGAHHAALVEVLVGRSETAAEPFQVLVPSSVFVSREESRRGAPVLRVRSFTGDALAAPARDQRWDRVRVVCSQPHDKHCQFGLSFVHIDSAEVPPRASTVPTRLLALDTFSSDEDDFKPGELFAKHQQATGTSADTGAQIRQATSLALKNITESSTKLLKTPISKPAARASSPHAARASSPHAGSHSPQRSERTRDSLLYTCEDAAPHARIDTVLSRHKHDQDNKKHDQDNKKHDNTKDNFKTKDDSNKKDKVKKDKVKRTPKEDKSESPARAQPRDDASARKDSARKRRRSASVGQDAELVPGPVSAAPHTLLRGAAIVLSGYENPRRAAVRSTALALGAQVLRDWTPAATHLICAFPNTPKLRMVRATAGDGVPVARAEWLDAMARRRRALPWRWYATEPRQRVPPPQLPDDDPTDDASYRRTSDSGDDTDEEIEKVLQAQKKRRLTTEKTSDDDKRADSTDVANDRSPPPRDPHYDADTDDEAGPAGAGGAGSGVEGAGGALPDFFSGLTFALDAAPEDEQRMTRYVLAYGGLVLPMSEVDSDSEVDYVVRGRPRVSQARGTHAHSCVVPRGTHAHSCVVPRGTHVPASWLAACHRQQRLMPHT